MTTMANTPRHPYAGGTASMQVDPEAPPPEGGASESFLPVPVLPGAACAGTTELDWVPDSERDLVPEPMRRLCGACPSRTGCLRWALGARAEGYWAATTTADREQMAAEASLSVGRADQLQAGRRAQAAAADQRDQAGALHPAGQGSLRWYRRGGCRCGQCRRFNSERRADERARAGRSRHARTVAA